METRANYILIGCFTLAVIMAAFGFVTSGVLPNSHPPSGREVWASIRTAGSRP